MSSKRIKTDNLEELFEIVKAIQNGEEPEEAVFKKREENAKLTDAMKPPPKREKKKPGKFSFRSSEKEKASEKVSEKDSEAVSDRISRIISEETDPDLKEEVLRAEDLNKEELYKEGLDIENREAVNQNEESLREDETDEFDKILNEEQPLNRTLSAAVGKAAGLFRSVGGRVSGSGKKRKGKKADASGKAAEKQEEKSDDSSYRAAAEGTEAAANKTAENEAAENKGVPEAEHMTTQDTAGESANDPENESESYEASYVGDYDDFDSEPLAIGKLVNRDRLSSKESIPPKRKLFKKNPDLKTEMQLKKNPEQKKEKPSKKLKLLSEKGKKLSGKTVAVIGIVALLVILIIIFIIKGILANLGEKEKSKNVTADEGLVVTIEQEPDHWCTSFPVGLKIYTRTGTINRLTINSVPYTLDENSCVAVSSSDYQLDITAVTENGELHARAEIPMIDSQPPEITVAKKDGQVVVNALDSRSEVAKIWWAAVKNNSFCSLPEYQLYDAPVPYEKNQTYYFYATDRAGNSSSPIVTSMEEAKGIKADAAVSLYPGETSYLHYQAEPEMALLNHLQFASGNENVISVNEAGRLTATGEGTAVITISADGITPAACEVTVGTERNITVSAIGDCTLGTDSTFYAETSLNAFDVVYGHDYFFKNVKEILENDDVTFANLEGPLTSSATKTSIEAFAFKGDPSFTGILTGGSIEAVTLANNHSHDYGDEGLLDTEKNLRAAGIDYCIDDEIAIREVRGVKTAFIGIYVLSEGIQCEERVINTIRRARNEGAQLVIVAFHWSDELATEPDDVQISLAHTAIDEGADLVVGHHPHVIQGIEKYNGKYIAYSIGNFCFGGNTTPADLDTIIVRQTFGVNRKGSVTYGPLEVIPCSCSSSEGYNDYQPRPAEGSEAERIMQKLNERSASFGQSFIASSGL